MLLCTLATDPDISAGIHVGFWIENPDPDIFERKKGDSHFTTIITKNSLSGHIFLAVQQVLEPEAPSTFSNLANALTQHVLCIYSGAITNHSFP